MDVFWPEIADSVARIEEIYEDQSLELPQRQLAALVASKVYYHLGSYNDALELALGSNVLSGSSVILTEVLPLKGIPSSAAVPKRTSVNGTTRNANLEYLATMVGKCIDLYIEAQKINYDRPAAEIVRFENAEAEMRVESLSPRTAKAARATSSETTAVSGSGEFKFVDRRMKEVVQKLFDQCLEVYIFFHQFTYQFFLTLHIVFECSFNIY